MKTTAPLVFGFLVGLVMFLHYFFPTPSMQRAYNVVLDWKQVVIGMTLILGVWSLVRLHAGRIQRRREGWGYSAVAMVGLAGMVLAAAIGGTERGPYNWLFEYVQAPMQATMFALLAFFVASASYRAFRARSVHATLLLVAGVVVMLGRVPIGEYLGVTIVGHDLSVPKLATFILDVPNLAAKRGILIGVGLGVTATALKILLGIERTYLGKGEGIVTLERLLTIDRRIIFLGVALAVLIPLLKPIGMPIIVAPESQAFHDALEDVEAGEAILFSFDYEADTRAELDPMAITVWRYCLERGVRVIALTNYPGGPGVAEAVFREMAEETGATYGEDFVFLGYNADWQGTMLRLGESIRATFPTDQYGTPTDEIPVMAGVDRYADVPLLVSIASSSLAEYWAIFAGGQYQQKVITGNTAVQAILVYPYYNAGQISGFLGGLKGAAELEVLTGIPGDATRGMDAQSTGHALIVLFILIGNGAYLAGRRNGGPKTPGGVS